MNGILSILPCREERLREIIKEFVGVLGQVETFCLQNIESDHVLIDGDITKNIENVKTNKTR